MDDHHVKKSFPIKVIIFSNPKLVYRDQLQMESILYPIQESQNQRIMHISRVDHPSEADENLLMEKSIELIWNLLNIFWEIQ